jgi:hypothetical protein
MEHGRVKQTALSRVTYDCLHTLHYTIMVLSPNKQRIEQLARLGSCFPLFQPLTNSGWLPLDQGSDLPLAPGFYTFDASLSIR